MKKVNLAVVGATGMVGRTFLKVLKERNFPINNLYLMASKRSAGTTLEYDGKEYVVEELTEHSFDKPIDIALFSAGGSTSEKFAPSPRPTESSSLIIPPSGDRIPKCPSSFPSATPRTFPGTAE